MKLQMFLMGTALSMTLAACGVPGGTTYTPTTRAAATADPLAFRAVAQDEARLAAQGAALSDMGARLERRATGKGLAIGSAAGCALVLVDASKAGSCVAGAAIGAVAGQMSGKRGVAKRVEIVSANDMVKAIRPMNDALSDMKTDLPALLAAQDAELTALAVQGGPVYAARFAEVRDMRANLAEALSLTEQQARAAFAGLEAAEAQGQTGLAYHQSAVTQIAKDSASARSKISLL